MLFLLAIPLFILIFLLFVMFVCAEKYGMVIGRGEDVISDSNAISISKEYARWRLGRQLKALSRHDRYQLALQTFLILMANEDIDKEEPVYKSMSIDSMPYKIFSDYKIDEKITNEVRRLIDEFRGDRDRENKSIEWSAYDGKYMCGGVGGVGGFQRTITREIMNILHTRAMNYGLDYMQAHGAILTMLMRYDTVIDFHLWSIPVNVYEALSDAGFNIEGYASPIDSYMLRLGKNPHSAFCSLYYDTDKCFGSLGRIQDIDIEKLPKGAGIVMVPPIIYELQERAKSLYDKFISVGVNCCMFEITKDILDNDVDKKCANVDERYEWHLEQFARFTISTKFTYLAPGDICMRFSDKALYKKILPRIKEAFRYIENTDDAGYIQYHHKMEREYSRWVCIQEILGLIGADAKTNNERNQYEYHNIIERFLLQCANNVREFAKGATDSIFCAGNGATAVYNKLEEELIAKHIVSSADAEGMVSQIRAKIDAWLKEPTAVKNFKFWYNKSGFFCAADGSPEFSTYMDRFRHMRMLDILRADGNARYDQLLVQIVCLRYACIMNRGQQWNFPFTWYECLYDKFGVRIELFASPLNSQLLLLGPDMKFCSLFYDVDQYFGSLGSIFELDILSLYRAGGCPGRVLNMGANPPYVEAIIDGMLDVMDKWFAICDRDGIKLRIFAGVPGWKDATFWSRILAHKMLVYSRVLAKGEYYYENSNDPKVPKIYHSGSYMTFILANFEDKGADYDELTMMLKHVKI